MDARKIQFLIGMQREIDKLETMEGNTPKIEKVKSRFYDVLEVEEIVKKGAAVEPDQPDTTDRMDIIVALIKELKEIKPTLSPTHKPREVVRFLKLFKYDNPVGYKELVHSPDDPQKFDFYNVLRLSIRHFISVLKENYLPYKLSDRLILLFETLSTVGLSYWDQHKQHPLYNEPTTTKVIQKFKQNYRFDVERSEASILRDLIRNIAGKVEYAEVGFYDKFESIIFLPDDDFFDINSIFFADVESFKSGLWKQFQSFIKHANINGESEFSKKNKVLTVETISSKDESGFKYQIKLCDVGATNKKQAEKVFDDFRGKPYQQPQNIDPPLQVTQFRSVCDWSIVSCFAGKPQQIVIQPFGNREESILPIKDKSCDGFTHIFTFYDV